MDAVEFRDWIEEHSRYKTGFSKWLGDDKGRYKVWFDALKPYPLEVAKHASMAVGLDLQASKLFMGDQLAEVRARCRSAVAAESMVPTTRTIICRRCSGGGLVSVIPAHHVRAMTVVGDTSKPGTLKAGTRPKTCAAICPCEAGNRYRTELTDGVRLFADFDERRMIDERELRSGPAKSEEIIAWHESEGRHEMVRAYRTLLATGRFRVDLVEPGELAAEPDYVNAF